MIGFDTYHLRPRQVLAARYEKDGSNRGLLTQHTLISSRDNSVNLILSTPEGEVTVEPGEWIVKVDGDFKKCNQYEFDEMFERVVAGVACIFCAERFKNVDDLRAHSATCEKHPANKKPEAPAAPAATSEEGA